MNTCAIANTTFSAPRISRITSRSRESVRSPELRNHAALSVQNTANVIAHVFRRCSAVRYWISDGDGSLMRRA